MRSHLSLLTLLITLAQVRTGRADEDVWRYRVSRVAVDAGIAAAHPVALETGLAKGFGAGLTLGDRFTIGARASWVTATEYVVGWTVRHDDLRLGLTGGARVHAGRGSFGLRVGLGGAIVHETRSRFQADVAGARGMAREVSATATFPVADVDAVIGLHIAGAWMMMVSGGPSFVRMTGAVHTGWTTQVGVAWQL
jgi:hypothetical protein